MAEGDGAGLAAVLAADAEFDVGAGLSAKVDGDLHQLSDAVAVDRLERVAGEDLAVLVDGEEPVGVVAAEAERGLGQVVGAEAEERRVFGEFVGDEGGAGISIIVPKL